VSTDAGDTIVVTPSGNTDDADGDGVTIADGDCDDTRAAVLGPSAPEVCGDGLDNDCDGRADYPGCTPYDDSATPDRVALDPLSFDVDGEPLVAFKAAEVTMEAGLQLSAGPSIFAVGIPVTHGILLDLRLTGATIEADLM